MAEPANGRLGIPSWVERYAAPIIVGLATAFGTLKLLDYRMDRAENDIRLQAARIEILQTRVLDEVSDVAERLARIEGYLERMEQTNRHATNFLLSPLALPGHDLSRSAL